MKSNSPIRLVYAGIVVLLYVLLVLGVPLFPDLLAKPVSGWFTVGMLIFMLLTVVAPGLAFIYLKQREDEKT